GCYGNPLGTTPHLDALAQQAFVFDNAYAPMPQTLPSHSTLFTGLSPRRHGAVENARTLHPDVATLAENPQARRWEPAALVGSGVVSSATGIQQGFTTFDEPHGVGRDSQHEVERPAEAVTDAALYWAGRREDEAKPFFLWAHYYDAHGPY